MTRVIDYALVADGASDLALVPILSWTLRQLSPDTSFAFQGFHNRGGKALALAVQDAMRKYHPALLFVHRDAERVSAALRRTEIPSGDHIVPVVPVRMTEAWLLIDLGAIRMASGNPNGKQAIELPRTKLLESLPDPKKELELLLVQAAGAFGGRRRKRFQQEQAAMIHRVAARIEDFSALRELDAFNMLWADLEHALHRMALGRR